MTRPVFDGHHDALTLLASSDGLVDGRPGAHLDLPRARAGGLAGAIWSVFSPSPGHEPIARPGGGYDVPIAEELPQPAAAAHATAAAGRLLALERAGALRVARSVADLDLAVEDGLHAAVLHLEGVEALDPELEALELWHAAGLRSLGPVWSRSNAFAHGVPFAFPASPDTGPGLTDAGRALVRRCDELGVMVDLSHLNAAGVADVAELSGRPLVASHSGAHAICACSRNLTDEQLRTIAATGGLVGIPFAVAFLRPDGAELPGETGIDAIVAHVRHVADLVGVDHVGFGSDFDGATIPAELGDVAGLPRLLDALTDDGFAPDEVARIAWGNWRRVLGASWA